MKRGRKQDDTLPPSRSRDVQRAFRARRAAYIANLEQRVKELEEENAALKARAGESADQPSSSHGGPQILPNSPYYPSTASTSVPPRRNTVGASPPTPSYMGSSSYYLPNISSSLPASFPSYSTMDVFSPSISSPMLDPYSFSSSFPTTGNDSAAAFWCTHSSPTSANPKPYFDKGAASSSRPILVADDSPLPSLTSPRLSNSSELPQTAQSTAPGVEDLCLNMLEEMQAPNTASSSDSSLKVKQEEAGETQGTSSSSREEQFNLDSDISPEQRDQALAKSIPQPAQFYPTWSYQAPAAPFQTPPVPRSEAPTTFVSCPLAWSIFSQIHLPSSMEKANGRSDVLSQRDVGLLFNAIEQISLAEHEGAAIQAIQNLIREAGSNNDSAILFAKGFIRQAGEGIKVSVRLLDEALRAMGCNSVDWANVGRYGVPSIATSRY
ncbi:hypothetical protein BT69DRAFT_1351282 [Atractiella rhizophila]|nr:hypothetical protein BT69DRAFT_1351282 [Atractiella rhizophila]